MIPQYLLVFVGIWIAEFTACLGGPLVLMERGEYCTRYNLNTDRWSTKGDQAVDLLDVAVMQNIWWCLYPGGCQTHQNTATEPEEGPQWCPPGCIVDDGS